MPESRKITIDEPDLNEMFEVRRINTKIAGVSHKNEDGSDRQKYIKTYVKPGVELILVREPNNKYDSNAIAVYTVERIQPVGSLAQIGYISKDISTEYASWIDSGNYIVCKFAELTGSTEEYLGVNVQLILYAKDGHQQVQAKPGLVNRLMGLFHG